MKQILGKVEKEIAIKCGIPEYAGKKIVLYPSEIVFIKKAGSRYYAKINDSNYFRLSKEIAKLFI